MRTTNLSAECARQHTGAAEAPADQTDAGRRRAARPPAPVEVHDALEGARRAVVARARVLGVRLDRQGRLVEPKRGDHGPIPPGVQPSARAAAACDGPSAADGSGGGI